MPDPEPLVVTQEDRDAAADWVVQGYPSKGARGFAEDIRSGASDRGLLVQAFARHASSARELGRKEGIEGAAKAVDDCNGERRYHEPTDWAYGAQDALISAAKAIAALTPSGPIANVERDLEAEARAITNNEHGRWWQSLTDNHRKALLRGTLPMGEAAFLAGVKAAIRALSGDKL